MADTIFNQTTGVELTPFVSKTVRTPSLTQVVNTSISGLPHIQNVGVVSYQLTVEFIIHMDNDLALMNAWQNGDLIKVVDDGVTRYGYITGVSLGEDYAEGYHEGMIRIHEEVGL